MPGDGTCVRSRVCMCICVGHMCICACEHSTWGRRPGPSCQRGSLPSVENDLCIGVPPCPRHFCPQHSFAPHLISPHCHQVIFSTRPQAPHGYKFPCPVIPQSVLAEQLLCPSTARVQGGRTVQWADRMPVLACCRRHCSSVVPED